MFDIENYRDEMDLDMQRLPQFPERVGEYAWDRIRYWNDKGMRDDRGDGDGFNLYPCNIPGGLCPDFVGVCQRGTECDDLRKVLVEACRHEGKYIRKRDQIPGRPSITIITDKWDMQIFNEFRQDFIMFAREDGCIINVILMTGLQPATIISRRDL